MALTTTTLQNTGTPLSGPDGAPLSQVAVLFTLVDKAREPIDVWDASDNARISGVVSATTNSNGEFSVELWPNDRGTEDSYYLCEIDNLPPILGQVTESVDPLPWVEFPV